MKKTFFYKLSTMVMLCAYAVQLHSGFAGRSAQQAADKYDDARNAYYRPGEAAADTSSNCPPPTTCSNSSNTSTYYVPTFVVQLNDETGTILHSHTFGTPTPSNPSFPSGFNLENAILIVHIFPKSNTITASAALPTYGKDGGTYTIAYTLKDPTGSMVYKEFNQNLLLAKLPHQITLAINPATPPTTTTSDTTSLQAASWSTGATTPIAQSIFIPNLTSLQGANAQSLKQQIVNGISPISQTFLITQDSGNASALPISGTFDADNTTTSMGQLNPFQSQTATSSTTPIGQFAVTFGNANQTTSFTGNQAPIITFANADPSIQFYESDLAKGLILNVCIFPSTNGNNYAVISTLRTMDGLKFHKKTLINVTGQTATEIAFLPTTISIGYAKKSAGTTITPLLTTSFLNSAATNQAFTIIGPLNLRFVIFRTKNGNFMVNMV